MTTDTPMFRMVLEGSARSPQCRVPKSIRVGTEIGLDEKQDHKQVLEEDADPQGRDQQGDARRVVDQQAVISHPLDHHPRHGAGQNGRGNGQPQRQSQIDQDQIEHIAAHHDDVAMGKVDQLHDAVHHAVSQSHQGIDTPSPSPLSVCVIKSIAAPSNLL